MKRLISFRSLYLAPLLATITILSGCAGSFSVPDTTLEEQGGDFGPIQGTVYGGHAPLVGAHVYLLQTGLNALGAQSISLLGSGSTTSPGGYPLQTNPAVGGDPHIPAGWEYVITDANGGFALTNGYKCSFNKPVYVYAYGGTPTANIPAPSGPNPSVVNLATLGLCPNALSFKGTVTYVYLNEVSTVATAYAFQGFTAPVTTSTNNDAAHIGYYGLNSSSEGLAGIQNAANNTLQLYDIEGSVAGHNANTKTYNLATSSPNGGPGNVPQATLNTLADILAACVDSSNTVSPPAAGSTCGILFATATADGTTTGLQPTDTATAAINIARHPAGSGYSGNAYASALFNDFTPTGAPFAPVLSVTPPDFTVALQFPTSSYSIFTGTQSPQSIALDASGNYWLTTQGTTPNPPTTYGTGYLAEMTPLGAVATSGATQIYNYNSNFTEGNIAIDSSQNAWLGTLDGVIAPIYEDGPSTGYVFTATGGIFTRPDAPVADNSTSSGDLFMVHGPTCPTPNVPGCTGAQNNPTLSEVLPGPPITSSGSCDLGPTVALPPGCSATNGMGDFIAGAYVTHAAIDAGGYIWMTSDSAFTNGGVSYNGSTTVRVYKTNGTLPLLSSFPINSSGSATCGNGIYSPEQPAIDAVGNGWIPIYGINGNNASVMVVSPLGTCVNFYSTGNGPYGAAVDGVSNIWITNRTDNTLTGLNYTSGVSLTGSTGPNFQPQNQGFNLLSDPRNVAVDISGDVFVTNFSGNSIVELIGLATPVYGPLGVAAGAGKIGQAP